MAITASDAGAALGAIAEALARREILEPEGYSVLIRLAHEVKRERGSIIWHVEVDRGDPILFKRTTDEKSRGVKPRIVAKGISVDQNDAAALPFKALDIALEIDDDANEPLSRWHLDLANKHDGLHQSGPLTHLQFGGHLHGRSQQDAPLKVPRWCHPPMEIGLLCELVAANFYEVEWLDIREEPSWCEAITLCERLCYEHYFDRIMKAVSISSSTALARMWASTYD